MSLMKGEFMAKKQKYEGEHTQKSIHQGGHSGLPVQPDGTLRESSNLNQPSQQPAKKGK
jgi:hypothetical protein